MATTTGDAMQQQQQANVAAAADTRDLTTDVVVAEERRDDDERASSSLQHELATENDDDSSHQRSRTTSPVAHDQTDRATVAAATATEQTVMFHSSIVTESDIVQSSDDDDDTAQPARAPPSSVVTVVEEVVVEEVVEEIVEQDVVERADSVCHDSPLPASPQSHSPHTPRSSPLRSPHTPHSSPAQLSPLAERSEQQQSPPPPSPPPSPPPLSPQQSVRATAAATPEATDDDNEMVGAKATHDVDPHKATPRAAAHDSASSLPDPNMDKRAARSSKQSTSSSKGSVADGAMQDYDNRAHSSSSSSSDETDDEHTNAAPAVATRSKRQPASATNIASPVRDDSNAIIDKNFCVTVDRHGKATKAECHRCGRSFAYMKVNLWRHAKTCSCTTTTAPDAAQTAVEQDTQAAAQSTSQLSTPKRLRLSATKRKALSDTAATPDVRDPAPLQDTSASSKAEPPSPATHNPKRAKHNSSAPPASPALRARTTQQRRATSAAKVQHTAAAHKAAATATESDSDTAVDWTRMICSSTVEHVCKMDVATRVTWLFGSRANAAAMRTHYCKAVHAVHAPHERFQQLTHELLSDLSAAEMVASAAPHTPFTVFMPGAHSRERVAAMTTESTLEAQAMLNVGCSMSFPAPAVVTELTTTPLAHELHVGALANAHAHSATVFCCQAAFELPWQFFRDDCFVLLLSGRAAVRTQPSAVRFPPCDFSPYAAVAADSMTAQQQQALETSLKVLCTASSNKTAPSSLQPPHDNDTNVRAELLESGAVLYIPSGTWFDVRVVRAAAWLTIRIASVTRTELVCDAVRQLCSMDEELRRPAAQLHDSTMWRQQLGAALQRLGQSISSLSSFDLIPNEALLSSGHDAHTVSVATPDASAAIDVHMDLRNHAFQDEQHLTIAQIAAFRVNPLALLLDEHDVNANALLPTAVQTIARHSSSMKSSPSAAVSKQYQLQQRHEHVYIVHVNFGDASARSRVRVHFVCDVRQAAIVEWVREQHGACFLASDVIAFAKTAGAGDKNSATTAAKYVLRFLVVIGFVSPIEAVNK